MQPQAPQADWLQGVITVEQEGAEARRDFIRKTYVHFLMGLMAFCGLVWGAMSTPAIIEPMLGVSMWVWFIGIMALSFAYRWFFASANMTVHYVGFGLTILLQAAVTAPLFYLVQTYVGGTILRDAFLLTSFAFGGLTAFALLSKKDFSFMGGFLWTATWVMIGVAIIMMFFGGGGGIWLPALFVLLFAGWVLYDTSMIQHHLPLSGYVFGATMLFIDFVVMLRQIVLVLASMAGDD